MDPQKIGKYTILSQIGKGGMGVVYKALDPTIGRTLAIKTIRFDDAGSDMSREEAQARFLREARSVGCLSHPNIVTIYEVGEDQGMSFIAMEYVEGGSLEDLLKKGKKFSQNEAIRLVIQLADALGHAHRRDIVHRDVKPGNILIDQEGRARLVDFGIARISASTITKSNAIMGTPYYMSPEQIMGKRVDSRADIFAVGAILYELLTSEKPFQGELVSTIIYKIVNEEPPPLRSYVQDLPAGLDAIVSKALAKDPDKRYQTCGDLIGDLTDYLRGAAPAPPDDQRKKAAPEDTETIRIGTAEKITPAAPAVSAGTLAPRRAEPELVLASLRTEPEPAAAPAAPGKRGLLWGGIAVAFLGLATVGFFIWKTSTSKPPASPVVPKKSESPSPKNKENPVTPAKDQPKIVIPTPYKTDVSPVNNSELPTPVKTEPTPVHPEAGASMVFANITHNATFPNEPNVLYMRFDGTMNIAPGVGHVDQVAVFFYYDNGNGTVGQPVASLDNRYVEANGYAICGTRIYDIPPEGLRANWTAWIPYAALGLPVGQWVSSYQGNIYQPKETHLLVQAVLFIDNSAVVHSPFVPIFVRK